MNSTSSTTPGWDLVACGVAVATLLALGLARSGPVVLVLALAYVTFVPGWALLSAGAMPDVTVRVALAVILSLTICGTGALAMVWLDAWHPEWLLKLSATLSIAALLASRSGLSRRRRS